MSRRDLPAAGWAVALVTLVMLATAAPAFAHPFIRGGEAPVGGPTSLVLAMAHGCGAEGDGEGEPTTEVSLHVPEWLEVVDAPPQDGWTIEQETDDAGEVVAVTWTNPSPIEAAPEFLIEVVASGEPGEEHHLRVFQACNDEEVRWVGTPDEPADDPAVSLTLTASEESETAPDAEDDADAGPSTEPEGDAGGEPEPDEQAADTQPGSSDEDGAAGADGEPDDGDDGAEAGDDGGAEAGDELAASPDDAAAGDDGSAGWVVAAVVAVAVLGTVAAVLLRRRGAVSRSRG